MFYDNTNTSDIRTRVESCDSVIAKCGQREHDLLRINGGGLIIALFQFLSVSVSSGCQLGFIAFETEDEMSQKGVPVVFLIPQGNKL